MIKIQTKIKYILQQRINDKNKERLTNADVTIISSNCTGGFIYHWLGLQFKSPFINLFMEPEDFLTALEHFHTFIDTPIVELENTKFTYPVGIGAYNTKIHFMHYSSFQEASLAWEKRKKRIDFENMCIMFSNWGGRMLNNLKGLKKYLFAVRLYLWINPFRNLAALFIYRVIIAKMEIYTQLNR